MVGDLVNAGAGLLIGLVTGFFFERRSTQSARAHNLELQAELSALRDSVYSVGGSTRNGDPVAAPLSHTELSAAILANARSTQDAQGRVRRSFLISHFVALGHSTDDVTMALTRLSDTGQLNSDERWVVLS